MPDRARTPPSLRSARPLAALALLALAGESLAQSLRYAEDLAPGIVNPLFSTTMSEARVNELLFGSLYADGPDLGSVPSLVSSASTATDGQSMTLTLRDDVRWHDGQPLRARDVVFTIEAMKAPETLSTEAGRVAFITSAEVLSERQVLLRFAEPQSAPSEKLDFKLLPAHAFDSPRVTRGDTFRTRPVGTGPYRLVRYGDDNSITFAANPDAPNPPKIAEIVLREVPDRAYQAKLLIYESLEALVRVLPRDLAMLQKNRAIELYPYQTNSWWYLGFNLARTPYDDVRVRQALHHYADVPALLAPIGSGDLLSGPFVVSSPFYNHDLRPRPHDRAQGDALLREAGYTRSGDTWTRGGQPLTVRLSAHQALESAQEVVINLQSQWRAAGVNVEVDFLDEAAWKARVWRAHDYEVVLGQWSFDRNEDVRDQLHSAGTRNFGAYKNPEVDRLLDEARATRDPQHKKALLRQVHALVYQDTPMIFLWTLDNYSAVNARVRDVLIHPFGYFNFVSGWTMQ